MPTIALVGIVGCIFLYFHHPSEICWIPQCPFYALTGFKCPGCGTLRGIHHLLHFRIFAAWDMNPLLIVMIPQIVAFLAWPKLSRSFAASVVVTAMIILHWLLRNIVDL